MPRAREGLCGRLRIGFSYPWGLRRQEQRLWGSVISQGPGPHLHPAPAGTLAPRRSWSMVFSASAYLVRSLW